MVYNIFDFFYTNLGVILPYIVFIVGALFARWSGYYKDVGNAEYWFSAVIACAVVVSVLLQSAYVEFETTQAAIVDSNDIVLRDESGSQILRKTTITYYNHESPIHLFIFFCAVVAVYGTVSVDTFKFLRKKAQSSSVAKSAEEFFDDESDK